MIRFFEFAEVIHHHASIMVKIRKLIESGRLSSVHYERYSNTLANMDWSGRASGLIEEPYLRVVNHHSGEFAGSNGIQRGLRSYHISGRASGLIEEPYLRVVNHHSGEFAGSNGIQRGLRSYHILELRYLISHALVRPGFWFDRGTIPSRCEPP
ncbi:hypothetical protein BDA99DRAFT_538740 [Phascolomyces articulosus]|uniref:Uncharacterized protein n=1 Tax=Phascolomyces articulosus TaxID=60185 RepID=A0AAD5PE58_9FUNG|nr:hypothetical protein BDA99DRAFT_538740 [Phascolomyces articulosus]